MPRPTLTDVALKAGVGVATVDRVLNARAFVRPETADRVFEAARALGYHGTPALRRRVEARMAHYRLGFLLLTPEQPFYEALEAGLRAACATAPGVRITPEVAYLSSLRPSDILAGLRTLAHSADAIAMVVIDHPAVTAAAAEIAADGVPVFTLLSDAAPGARYAYLGVDNLKAGRTAGWLLARTVRGPGKVAIFVGSHRFHGHELRETGYRSYLRDAAPELSIIDTQLSLEHSSLAHEAVLELIGQHADLRGIYLAGGGAEGAIAALREATSPGTVALICNELNDILRAGLADGFVSAVISTPIAALARETVAQMTAALAAPGAVHRGQTFLPFEIYVSENV